MNYLRDKIKEWFSLEDIGNGYTVGYDAGYKFAYETALNNQRIGDESLIERKATNMFCEGGYPNPLHVFDISPSGIPYLGQEPITKERAKQLKQEAGLLKTMLLYDVIQETIRQEAITKSITLSKNWEEVLTGKTMLVNLGIIKKIVDKISSVDIDKLPANSGGIEKIVG